MLDKYFSLFDWTGLFIHTMYQVFISFDLLGTHYLKKNQQNLEFISKKNKY